MRGRMFQFWSLFSQPVPLTWLNGGHASLAWERLNETPPEGIDRLVQFRGGVRADLVEWDGAAQLGAPWMELAARAIEPNVFLDPAFALPAAQHIPAARRPQFLMIWLSHGPHERLIGLFAINAPSVGYARSLHLWSTPMMASGLPLLCQDHGGAAIEALCAFVARQFPYVEAIVVPEVHLHGPFVRLLRKYAQAHERSIQVFDRRSRAIVTNDHDKNDFLQRFISARKRKELRRQRRRLEDLGALTYSSVSGAREVQNAMERFMALEASGWKGGQSTALLSNPSTATFARAMVRNFAHRGACRIDALELDGRPLAMGIVLTASDIAYFWKTAYDESFARYSPGVHFSLEMTKRIIFEGKHQRIDSCAIPNHPMIDHIWRERQEIGDLAIATLNARPARLAFALGRESARRRIRSALKQTYYAISGKHPR